MNLNHLHLKVASVERARLFYQRFFGLAESARHGDILFMRDGAGMDLALAPASKPVEPPAWFHFGFRLETPDAVAQLYQELVGAGTPMRQALGREDDLAWFRCLDPDGYEIEVYWEPEPAPKA
jgi:catechol-2,3-dioxygenase